MIKPLIWIYLPGSICQDPYGRYQSLQLYITGMLLKVLKIYLPSSALLSLMRERSTPVSSIPSSLGIPFQYSCWLVRVSLAAANGGGLIPSDALLILLVGAVPGLVPCPEARPPNRVVVRKAAEANALDSSLFEVFSDRSDVTHSAVTNGLTSV